MPAEFNDQIDDFVASYYLDSAIDSAAQPFSDSSFYNDASDTESEDIAFYALYDRCDYDSDPDSSSCPSSPTYHHKPLTRGSSVREKTVRWLDRIAEEQESPNDMPEDGEIQLKGDGRRTKSSRTLEAGSADAPVL